MLAGNLQASLTDDCFPHAARACSPQVEQAIPPATISPFLSSFGKYVLLESNYVRMSRLEQFLFTRKHFRNIPNHCYVVGSIAGKYNFSLALRLPDAHSDGVTVIISTKNKKQKSRSRVKYKESNYCWKKK
jgi:hypothetical protein